MTLARRPIAGYEFQGFRIPDYMADGLSRWIDYGVGAGHFLMAVLENDLAGAVGHADENNMRALPAYIMYLYNEAPAECWGSQEKCRRWAAMKAKERADV